MRCAYLDKNFSTCSETQLRLKSIKCKQGTLHWTSYIALPSIEIESNAVLDWFAYYSCIQKINLIDSIIKCDVSLRQVLDRCIVAYKYINVRLVHTVKLRYTSSSLTKGDYPWRFSIHWINKHRRLSPLESKDGTLRQSPKKLILNAGMWVNINCI